MSMRKPLVIPYHSSGSALYRITSIKRLSEYASSFGGIIKILVFRTENSFISSTLLCLNNGQSTGSLIEVKPEAGNLSGHLYRDESYIYLYIANPYFYGIINIEFLKSGSIEATKVTGIDISTLVKLA